jgi:L-phenylalanine/L-methionine N-acetyltransferase
MAEDLALRSAATEDLAFLSELASHPEAEPYLAPGAGEIERLEAILTQAELDGPPSGLFVIERRAAARLGGLALAVYSPRSRICNLTTLMVTPAARRSGVASHAVRLACRHALVDHGFHRLQAETYGDNLAGQRLFESLGFVREGVRRKAYWRRERWLDGIIFGILADELDRMR